MYFNKKKLNNFRPKTILKLIFEKKLGPIFIVKLLFFYSIEQ